MTFSFIASLILSILLVVTTKLNLTSTPYSLLLNLTNPLTIPITYIRQQKDSFFDFLFSTPVITKQIKELKNENNELKLKNKKLSDLITDQNQLKNLLNHTWHSVPVKLVSIDSLAIFTSLSFANIRPGQPVASGNSLVGLVKSVEPPIIKVVPLNHPEIKLSAQLDTGAKGDLIFKDNETRVINLDSNLSFNSKTTVFTLPSNFIPENLIVGQIDKIVSDPANPTQEVLITLDQEISKANDFFIITSP